MPDCVTFVIQLILCYDKCNLVHYNAYDLQAMLKRVLERLNYDVTVQNDLGADAMRMYAKSKAEEDLKSYGNVTSHPWH